MFSEIISFVSDFMYGKMLIVFTVVCRTLFYGSWALCTIPYDEAGSLIAYGQAC